MQTIILDFETYYAADYSLTDMTIDGYVRDPRFHVHGAAIWAPAVHTAPIFLAGADLSTFIEGVDWANTAMLAHNTAFDGFILAEHYGRRAGMYLDTMSMARALVAPAQSVSLDALAKLYGLPNKGMALGQTKGVRDLPPQMFRELAEYAKHDAWLCAKLFKAMTKDGGFPKDELRLLDLSLRMFIEPTVMLDEPMLRQEIEDEAARMRALIDATPGGAAALRSDAKFAALLAMRGVEPPKKISIRTGKEAYAFAKTDEGMLALLDHEGEEVRMLAQARLGVKSANSYNRAKRLHEVALTGKPWPVMIHYYGARTTGRFSGGNKQNPQNLGAGRQGATPVLRNSVKAPPGHRIVVVDSAQIEARKLAWVAGQADIVEAFARKEDVYALMASKIYRRPINKKDNPDERFVGKEAVLGCGYQMGGKRFQAALNAKGVKMTVEQSTEIVNGYRNASPNIVALWKRMNQHLFEMTRGVTKDYGCYSVVPEGLQLPNGFVLKYPGLKQRIDGWTYEGKRGVGIKMFPGKLTENLIQALARIVVCTQMLEIEKQIKPIGGRIWLMAHDEVDIVVPEAHAADVLTLAVDVMRTPPRWAAGLPLDAEGSIGLTYGEAK